MESLASTARRDGAKVSPSQRERLQQAMTFIRAHCLEKPRLKLVAAQAGLSPYHFHRLFHDCFGKTFKRVITELQVEEAKRLLVRGVSTVETGTKAGFANQSHFTARFKLITGSTPAAWRRHMLRDSQPLRVDQPIDLVVTAKSAIPGAQSLKTDPAANTPSPAPIDEMLDEARAIKEVTQALAHRAQALANKIESKR